MVLIKSLIMCPFLLYQFSKTNAPFDLFIFSDPASPWRSTTSFAFADMITFELKKIAAS
jgi:hypothetical protein